MNASRYAFILAGGVGSRLCLLSERRAKPAVPFGGKYRIIDFTLSNCVNSGIFDIGVLTQFESVKSMMRYLPPNGTAGFARRSDSRHRRVPTPPARMNA